MQCYLIGCAGSNNGYCYPYIVWSGSAQSSRVYWSPELLVGGLSFTTACGTGYCPDTLTFSVRCVCRF